MKNIILPFNTVPVISFSTSIYYGSESTNPVITLTRSGDIYIGVSVIVEITSISNPNDLSKFLVQIYLHLPSKHIN